jgi:hypothetical protein
MRISALYVYPVKACRALSVEDAVHGPSSRNPPRSTCGASASQDALHAETVATHLGTPLVARAGTPRRGEMLQPS